MRSPNHFGACWPLLLCGAAGGCSASTSNAPQDGGGGAAAGQAGSAAQATAGVQSGAGAGAGGGNVVPVAGGGAGAAGGSAAQAGASGAPSGGTMSANGSAGSSAGQGQGGAGTSAVCDGVASEYRAELDRQLSCNPNAGQQCTDRAAAAPGCECRVFIEPTDPFAIEHLSNVANGWFDADCSMPSCPATCSTATAGTCQADVSSPLGGRCVSP